MSDRDESPAKASSVDDGSDADSADDADGDTPACGDRTAVSTPADASPDASFDVAPELFGTPRPPDAAR
jgi:hypothetical protein